MPADDFGEIDFPEGSMKPRLSTFHHRSTPQPTTLAAALAEHRSIRTRTLARPHPTPNECPECWTPWHPYGHGMYDNPPLNHGGTRAGLERLRAEAEADAAGTWDPAERYDLSGLD